MNALLPKTLFHATPPYRYDPQATANHGVWDPARHGQIKGCGLKPSMHSSRDVPAVFLTDEVGIAANYAGSNRGEEWPVDWLILAVASSALDPTFLLPDLDQEAQIMADDIFAQGCTPVDWQSGTIPWHAVFRITGQVRYSAAILDTAIVPFKHLPVDAAHR